MVIKAAWLLFPIFFCGLSVESQSSKPILQKDACREFMPAVVRVDVADGNATGFIVSPDGWILTAGHVVIDPRTGVRRSVVSVQLPDRTIQLAKTFIDVEASIRDFAILKVEAHNLPFLELAQPEEAIQIPAGTDLAIIGYPFSAESKFSPTIHSKFCLSATVAATDTVTYDGINIDAIYFQGPSVKGISGAPVISRDTGHVVGIQSAKLAGVGFELLDIRDQLNGLGSGQNGVSAKFTMGGADVGKSLADLISILDRHIANGLGFATGASDASRYLTVTKRAYERAEKSKH